MMPAPGRLQPTCLASGFHERGGDLDDTRLDRCVASVSSRQQPAGRLGIQGVDRDLGGEPSTLSRLSAGSGGVVDERRQAQTVGPVGREPQLRGQEARSTR